MEKQALYTFTALLCIPLVISSPPRWRAYTSSSYYYTDYTFPKPQSKHKFVPGPQYCPDTGRTVCKGVRNYPEDHIYQIVSTTKARRFNFTTVFMDERDGDVEPNNDLLPEGPPKVQHDGYVVYQTAVHYDYHVPSASVPWRYSVGPASSSSQTIHRRRRYCALVLISNSIQLCYGDSLDPFLQCKEKDLPFKMIGHFETVCHPCLTHAYFIAAVFGAITECLLLFVFSYALKKGIQESPEDLIAKPIIRRQREDDERPVCPARTMYVSPQAALNDNSEWKYIVNVQNRDSRFKQVIRVDLCQTPDEPCSSEISLPFGFVSRCKQKFIKKKLLALDADGQGTSSENFFIPSCCVCHITRTNQRR